MLCSVSLGVGVFVLPSVLLTTGVFPGIILLVIYAIMATFCQIIAIESVAITKNVSNFETLASKSLGKCGEFFLAFFMMISLLIGNCGHIQTVGQLLHDIIEWFYTNEYGKYKFDADKTMILYTIMLSFTIPWLFQRSLKGLSSVGTLSVITVLITAFSLVIVCITNIFQGKYAQNDAKPDYTFDILKTNEFWTKNLWQAAPTCAFVYTGLLELFPVFSELNSKDIAKTKKHIYISSFICAVVYIIVSVIVIVTYGQDIQPNSLYNVPADNYWITFCCFCLVIVITLLYPVINYPMVSAFEVILDMCGCCANNTTHNASFYQHNNIDPPRILYVRLLYNIL